MTKLLSANFLRLRKSVLFWGTLALSFAFGLFTVYTRLSDKLHYGIEVQLDSILFFYAMVIGLVSAVFISLFFGTEYSDGSIRNKVVVGQSRLAVYFANLLTGYVVTLLSTAAYLLAVFGLGVPTLGSPTLPAQAFLLNLLGTLAMEAAFCAIFTFVTMNCAKKAVSAVACILLFFALTVASTYVKSRLDANEFIVGYYLSVNGQVTEADMEPNPMYLRGAERAAYEFVYDLLPTGQASQYTMMEAQRPARLALCAAAVCAMFTGAGAALFRRKDLK